MNIRFAVPLFAVLAIAAPNAYAQAAKDAAHPHPVATEQINQRAQKMDAMMSQAKGAHGAQRMELMKKHMQLMQEQMRDMGSMMGNGGMMAAGAKAADGHVEMMGQMHARMDMMQGMMGQMLDQQNLMMQQQKDK